MNINNPLALKLIEFNNPKNTGNPQALKLKDSYQLPANYNLRINWLENKMCRHLDDSCHTINNYSNDGKYGKNNYVHCTRINWPKNKMCHHVYDSYRLPDQCLSNYLIDSYQLPEKNIMCHLEIDSYYPAINTYDICLVATRQLKLTAEQETIRKPSGTSIPATGRDNIPAFL